MENAINILVDQLIKDPDEDVRVAVAKQGHGLEQLINDPDCDVREAATLALEKLMGDDPSCTTTDVNETVGDVK